MKACISMATIGGLMLLAGCSQSASDNASPSPSAPLASATVDGSKFLIGTEPEGAKDVIPVRLSALDGEDVLIVGRIGGSRDPWVAGRASFTIVDNSIDACSDIPGDDCKTPWDYCCRTPELPTSTALIKVVDENGNPVKVDARELLHVKELSTVVVKGKAQRDEAGNLTVLASGIHVRK